MTHPQASPLFVALAGCAAMAVGMGIGRFVYTPILPGMAAGLDLDAAAAGWIATANFAGYLVGCLVLIFAGATRRRALLVAGLGTSVATSGLMALASDLLLISLLRFASGIASALVMVAGGAIVLDTLMRARRPVLGGLHWAGVGLGITLSGLAVALTPALDWRGHWLIATALSLPLAAAAVFVLRGRDVRGTVAGGEIGAVGALAVLVAAHTLEGLGYSVYGTFVVQLFRETPALADFAGLVWVVVGLGAVPSAILAARASARFGALPSFAAGFFIQTVAIVLPLLAPGAASALVSAALFGGTLMGITLLAVDAGRALAGPRGLAIVSVGFATGQMVGPYAAGLIAVGRGGLDVPVLLSAGVVAVGGLLATGLALSRRG